MNELFTAALELQHLIRSELKPLLELQEKPENLARLEQKIREHNRPFTTLPPPPAS